MTSSWCFFCYLSSVSIVDFEKVNVSWVKTIQKKNSYCEIILGAGVPECSLKQVFGSISQKLQENNCAGISF